jgi:hypothetical protein
MVSKTRLAMAMAVGSMFSSQFFLAQGQDAQQPHYQVGIVYYASDGSFKALDKEVAPQSGRSNYSAKVQGAHATVRLRGDQPKVFRVCGVDPSRFKLYRFKSEKNGRTVTIAKTNMWIGGSKTVLSESEVPVAIQTVENGCFTLTPQTTLADGEYGFSPAGDMDAFMFGVGDVQQSR